MATLCSPLLFIRTLLALSNMPRSRASLEADVLEHFLSFQVLRDVPKARREVELHWAVSNHKHIVSILDIYENTYNGVKCLLVVMEW